MTDLAAVLMPTPTAVRECAEWLATCIRLGWTHSDLDWLEELWWKHHDRTGALKSQKRIPPPS